MTTCDMYIDRLVQFFTSADYHGEILSAKKEFFEQAGIIDEESHYFESRMAQFLDWYIFTRPLNQYHLPPVQLVLSKDIMPLREEERLGYESIANAIHSLFEFTKVRSSDVHVYDLFSKKKHVLKNSNLRVGFNPEEIFDARIIPFEGNYVFSKGFCFHPAEAKKFILKEVKKVRHLEREQHEALMFKIMKMRYKLEQYKHIKLEYIYTNDPQLKL